MPPGSTSAKPRGTPPRSWPLRTRWRGRCRTRLPKRPANRDGCAETPWLWPGRRMRALLRHHEDRRQREIPVQQRPRQADQHGQHPEDQQHLPGRRIVRRRGRPGHQHARPPTSRPRPATGPRGGSSAARAKPGRDGEFVGSQHHACPWIRGSPVVPKYSNSVLRVAARPSDASTIQASVRASVSTIRAARPAGRFPERCGREPAQNQGGLPGTQQKHLARRDRQSGQIFAERELPAQRSPPTPKLHRQAISASPSEGRRNMI